MTWVPRKLLQIPTDRFAVADLEKPPPVSEKFDLALCLEVAEHLPSSAAEQLVRSLISLAPAIAFSAAIPLQGGQNHVHCRWQSYWAELFRAHGYEPVDCIRNRVWRDPRVTFCYAQNLIRYCHHALVPGNPRIQAERDRTRLELLDIVHPDMYFIAAIIDPSLRNVIRQFSKRAWNFVHDRLPSR